MGEKVKQAKENVKENWNSAKNKMGEKFDGAKETMKEKHPNEIPVHRVEGHPEEKTTMEKMQEAASDAYDYTAEKLKQGAEAVKEGVQSAKEAVKEGVQSAKEAVKEGVQSVKETIVGKDEPKIKSKSKSKLKEKIDEI